MTSTNKMENIRQQLQAQYVGLLKYWPKFNETFNLDEKYKNNYQLICDQMKKVKGYELSDDTLCPTFFGFLENINSSGKNIFANHNIWSDFIEWSYQKQKDPSIFTRSNLDKFVSSIEYLIKKNVESVLGDAEVLNKNNVKLKNVMKLHYFLENLGDIKQIIIGNHDENYPPYCHFINDCLDIYKAYNWEVCSPHSPKETKPNNICKLFNDFEIRYRGELFPDIKYRQALIETNGNENDVFGRRLQCKFKQKEYGSRPIESFFAEPNPGFFTWFNKIMITSASAFLVLMFFFLLYKLTPIQALFGSKEERRRSWMDSEDQRREPYGNYYREQFDSEYGTESRTNFGSESVSDLGTESGTNFGSESVSDLGTESGTNFGSESVSDFGTESGTNFGSESVSDFGTERGTSYGGRQGSYYGGRRQGSYYGGRRQGSYYGGRRQESSYGGSYGEDNSSYMS